MQIKTSGLMHYDHGIDIEVTGAFTDSGVLSDYSTPELHTHPYDQFLWIKNGVALFEGPGKTMPQYSDMTAFIPAGFPHRTKVIGSSVEYKSLYLRPDLQKTRLQGLTFFQLSNLGRALFERLTNDTLVTLLDDNHSDYLLLFLKTAQEDIERKLSPIFLPRPEHEDAKKIADYIHQNYSQKITLTSISGALPFTVRHSSRIFRNDVNMSILSYLRLYRALQASIQIQTGSDSITSIAFSNGYETLSSFYRDFHKFFGSSPTAFRNSSQNK